MKEKKKVLLVLGILVAVISVVGVSYAVWQLTLQQTDKNVVTTGCFRLNFLDANDIVLEKAYPMSPNELSEFFNTAVPYHFTLTNTCDSRANAVIQLETLPVEGKKLDDQYVSLLFYNGTKTYQEILENDLSSNEVFQKSNLNQLPFNNENKVLSESLNAYKLHNFTLEPNESKEFNTLLYLNPDTPAIEEVMNANWKSKITVTSSYVNPTYYNNMMMARVKDDTSDNYEFFHFVNQIVFQNTLQPIEGIEPIDVSYLQDGSVLAYVNESMQEVTIQANGKIFLPENSSFLFSSDTEFFPSIIGFENLDTSKVVNMSSMFSGSGMLETLDLSNFNTSNVIDMSYMFSGCSSLTSLDLGSFNTSNVTNMSHMFEICSGLSSLDLSNFDTSNVIDMNRMFYGCGISELNINSFDTSKVVNMNSMFDECVNIMNLDLSSFTTENVTDMSSMFWRCSSLTTLDLSSFNTSNVINMKEMFFECNNLTTLDLSTFNTSNVTDMSAMFDNCSSLTSLNLNNFNTSKVTNMRYMFGFCSSLTSLDLSNFDTTKVTDMSAMFDRCSSLTSLNLNNFNTTNVTDMDGMFYECSILEEIIYGDNFIYANNAKVNSMFYYCPANRPTHSSWDGVSF